MSRVFSSSAHLIKELKWKLNGTTEDVDWVKKLLNEAVDKAPGLAGKVDSGIINGNPHPTCKDPLHASGVTGKSSIKGKNRVTSFHAYPDGLVRFSNKAFGEIKVQGPSTPAESSGVGTKK